MTVYSNRSDAPTRVNPQLSSWHPSIAGMAATAGRWCDGGEPRGFCILANLAKLNPRLRRVPASAHTHFVDDRAGEARP